MTMNEKPKGLPKMPTYWLKTWAQYFVAFLFLLVMLAGIAVLCVALIVAIIDMLNQYHLMGWVMLFVGIAFVASVGGVLAEKYGWLVFDEKAKRDDDDNG